MKQASVLRIFVFIFIISSYQVSFTASAAKFSGQTFGVWVPAPTLQMYYRNASRVNYQGLLPEATLVYQDLCQCDPALVRIVLDYVENIAHVSYQDFKSSYEQDRLARAIVSDVGKRIDQYVQSLKDHKISLAALPAHKEEVSKQANDLVNEIKAMREKMGEHYSAPLAKLVCRIWMDFEKTDAQLKEILKKKNEAEQIKFKLLRHCGCVELYDFLMQIAQETGLSQEMLAEDKTNQRQQRFLAVVHHAITKNAFYCFSPDYAKLELKNGIIHHRTQGRDAVKNYITAEYRAEVLRGELRTYQEEKTKMCNKELQATQTALQKAYDQSLVDCNLLPSNKVQSLLSQHSNAYGKTLREFEISLGGMIKPEQVLISSKATMLDVDEHEARTAQQQIQQQEMHALQKKYVEASHLVFARVIAAQRSAVLKSWKNEQKTAFAEIIQRQHEHKERQQEAREALQQEEQFYRQIVQTDQDLTMRHHKIARKGLMTYLSWLSQQQAAQQTDFNEALQRQTQREQRALQELTRLQSFRAARAIRLAEAESAVPAQAPRVTMQRHNPYAALSFGEMVSVPVVPPSPIAFRYDPYSLQVIDPDFDLGVESE